MKPGRRGGRWLNSKLTLLLKLGLPALYLSTFMWLGLAMLQYGEPYAHVVLACTAVVGLLFWHIWFPLKAVSSGSDGLTVYNYIRAINIPYQNIESIEENKWSYLRPVKIVLKKAMGFGKTIKFIPYLHVPLLLAFWKEHPVVSLLKRRIRSD